jgi:hypothetical protein
MTGADHYREAESLIQRALEASDGETATCWSFDEAIRAAQVHALLALAAAVVDGPAVMRPEDRDEWDRVTGRLEPEAGR